MKTFFFEGKMYPYPQARIYVSLPLSLEVLTSPDGPVVNHHVEEQVDKHANESLKRYAVEKFGNKARVEDITLVKAPVIFNQTMYDQADLWPVEEAVWTNYYRRHRSEYYDTYVRPPIPWYRFWKRWCRLESDLNRAVEALFGATEANDPLDTPLPLWYSYCYTARVRGPIDLGDDFIATATYS